MFEVADLLAGLELEDVGDGRFRAPNMDFYAKSSGGAASQAVSDVVAGGQLLSQAIVATTVSQPGKTVKSIHAVFARTTTSILALSGRRRPSVPRTRDRYLHDGDRCRAAS